jgi:hypothetical protein
MRRSERGQSTDTTSFSRRFLCGPSWGGLARVEIGPTPAKRRRWPGSMPRGPAATATTAVRRAAPAPGLGLKGRPRAPRRVGVDVGEACGCGVGQYARQSGHEADGGHGHDRRVALVGLTAWSIGSPAPVRGRGRNLPLVEPGDDLLLTPAVVRSEAGHRCAICHARCVASGAVRRPGRADGRSGMSTILLLIAALLAVTSAVCMVWIRMAADHRHSWNLAEHSRPERPRRARG